MSSRVERGVLPQEPILQPSELSQQLQQVLSGGQELTSQLVTDSLIYLKRLIEFSKIALIAGKKTISFSTSTLQLPRLIKQIIQKKTPAVSEIEMRELRIAVNQVPDWLVNSNNERVADNNDFAHYSENQLVVSVNNIKSILQYIVEWLESYSEDGESEYRKIEGFADAVLSSSGDSISNWRNYLRQASRVDESKQLDPILLSVHYLADLLIDLKNPEFDIQQCLARAQDLLKIAEEHCANVGNLHLTGTDRNLLTTTELHPELSALLSQFRDLVNEFDLANRLHNESAQLKCLERAINFYDARLKSYNFMTAEISKNDPKTGD